MRARTAAAFVWLVSAVAAVTGQSRSDVMAKAGQSLTAPARLGETGLYESGRFGVLAGGVQPFSPQYPLWSDGAAKTRWVYLPPGSSIDVSDPANWEFPVGTRFWKEFRFGGRPIETRFLWRATLDRWIAGSYVWNDTGTDAALAPADGVLTDVEVGRGRRHTVPRLTDCWACHGTARVEPLGFNALQLSTDRDPNAVHGEPLTDDMVTIATLDRGGRFSPARAAFVASPPRIEARDPDARALAGYLSTNCGSCHRAGRDVVRLGVSLKHSDVVDGDAVLAAMARHRTDWQVPGVSAGESRLADPAAPDRSAILRRMGSRRPSSQMPPLGTAMEDQQALDAVTRWISGLEALPH